MAAAALTPIIRKHPPLSVSDSAFFFRNSAGSITACSTHREANVFYDDEIITTHPTIRTESIGDRIIATFSEHNKAIIQQQSIRGCTAATAAMLIMDHGGQPDLNRFRQDTLGNTETISDDIRAARKTPSVGLGGKNIQELRIKILEGGAAIVSICDPEIGGHSIVVDDISPDCTKIRLRDPYHGWEICVKAAAFVLRWSSASPIVQIR